MLLRVLLVLSFCLTAGCSYYDVGTRAADMALLALTGPNDRNDRNKNGKDHEPVFWDRDVSECIQSEIKARTLDQQLDAVFDAAEEGREYVILPNGERYRVHREAAEEPERPGPTAECIDRHSD